MSMANLFIDGAPATADDLTHLALVNYGAYTSFRVEQGGVRGLDLHLARLDASAEELFGEPVGEAILRDRMRTALDGRADAWLRVSLFSPHIGHRDPSWVGAPQVVVGVFDPPPPLAGSLRLQTREYAREEPHLKHAATFGLMRARRAAMRAGFDDALFVGVDGRISEGTLWSIGFLEGDMVVWPEAPMLAGVTQAVLARGLAARGAPQQVRAITRDDLAGFDAAFICNSATPAASITRIDELSYADRPDMIERLRAIWSASPLQPI